MKVLHILNELRHSGAETALARMAPYAAADGVHGEILAVVERDVGPYAANLRASGYTIHELQFTRDLRFPLRAHEFFRAHRFDVVHIHCERASFWLAAAAWFSGTRRILRTVHGYFGFEGALRLRRKIQRKVARRVFGVRTLAVSPWVAANETSRFGNPTQIVPLCVDIDAFRPPSPEARAAARRAFGITDGEVCVAIVGACDPVKAHDVAFAALARSGLPIRVLHAGTGPTEADERVQTAALGIAGRVSFLGARDDVPTILAASDIFLMPSRVETLGLAAVEAMAAGLPCVLGAGTGMEALRAFDGVVEWVPCDADAIAGAISRLSSAPEAALRARALAASDAVRAEFSPDTAWRRLRGFYGI